MTFTQPSPGLCLSLQRDKELQSLEHCHTIPPFLLLGGCLSHRNSVGISAGGNQGVSI